MKTLRLLTVRTSPFSKTRSDALDHAVDLMEKFSFGKLKIQLNTLIDPHFLDDAKLESDDDLDEYWVQEKLSNLRYHIVHVDLTDKEWKRLGLRPSLYGQSRVVTTKWGKQAIQYGRWNAKIGYRHAKKLPRKYHPIHPLTVGFWHEACHSLSNLLNVPDLTHFHFYGEKDGKRWQRTPTPSLAWMRLPFYELQPLKTRDKMQLVNLLSKLRDAMLALLKTKKRKTLLHPVAPHRDKITQEYGVYNRRYHLTHRHIGTDYACPVGTPVRAPADGEVTVAGTSETLGKHCHYRYKWHGKTYVARFLHLSTVPRRGRRKRGDVVAYTGNTGSSTGAHIHIDVWQGDVQLDRINRKNWQQLTLNPQKHYETKTNS